VTAEDLFWQLAAELRADDTRIVEATIVTGNGCPCPDPTDGGGWRSFGRGSPLSGSP